MARSDGLPFYMQTLDSLIAASDESDTVQTFDAAPVAMGITDGVGNQGTANQAHLVGQAGTAGTAPSVPRSIQGGRQQ